MGRERRAAIISTDLGKRIAKLLHLHKRSSDGRYSTSWGTKTDLGLGETIIRVVEEETGRAKVFSRVIRKGKHCKGCCAMRNWRVGEWSTPWSSYPERFYSGDTLGRRDNGGTTRWVIFRCNCARCKATVSIMADEILKVIDLQLGDEV